MWRGENHTEIRPSCDAELADLINRCEAKGGLFFDHGARLLDGAEQLVLLVSHNFSLTGAPIVLLHAANVLKRMGMRPLLVSPIDGLLRAEALVQGIATLLIPFNRHPELAVDVCHAASLVIANTIETCVLVDCLNGTDVPVLWWIHEAEECYSPQWVDLLPRRLYPNVTVMTAGPVARKSLLARRPNYEVGELLYALPDKAAETVCERNLTSIASNCAGKKVFALIGTVEPRKGQDILLDAIRTLPHAVAESCHFVFVGACRDRKTAKKVRSVAAKTPECVTYIPQIPHKDISCIYAKADCLICASRSEPMSVTVNEACMFSKPTICADSGGMAELLDTYNAGLVFKAGSAEELAACICHVCEMDDNLLDEMGARARALYESNFTEKVFERHISFIVERASRSSLALEGNQTGLLEEMRKLSCEIATLHGQMFRQEHGSLWEKALHDASRRMLLFCVLPMYYRITTRHL